MTAPVAIRLPPRRTQPAVAAAWTLMGLMMAAAAAADQPSLTQADLLRRMIDLERLTRPPEGERFVSVSADAGAAAADAEGWHELAALEGPGVIDRIWFERITGQVRIVLDGEPALERPCDALFDGSLEPFGVPLAFRLGDDGPGICRVPMGYMRRCRILARGMTGRVQIDVTRWPAGTRVARFTTEFDAAGRDALATVRETLNKGLGPKLLYGKRPMSLHASQDVIGPGQTLTLSIDNPGTIRSLLLSFGNETMPRERYFAHRVIVRIYWDGHRQPDVEVPVAEFFGTAFDRNLFRSLVLGTDRWEDIPFVPRNEAWFFYSFWPMPFTRARIEIENRNRLKISRLDTLLVARVERRPPPQHALRFRAVYPVRWPPDGTRLRWLSASGPGWLVGWTLAVDAPGVEDLAAARWVLQADGQHHNGTLAGFFGLLPSPRPAASPLSGVTLRGTFGRNAMYRWLIGDAIAFRRRLRLELDLDRLGLPNDAFFASVLYWYAPSGAVGSALTLTDDVLKVPPLRIPGSVEIEGHIAGTGWGRIYRLHATDRFELSGEAAALIRTRKAVRVRLPVARAGRYRLKLRTRPGRSFKPITVRDETGELVGVVEYRRRPDAIFEVGTVELKAGENVLTVQCDGATYLDCWVLEPLREG